jgi:hypothetical protein
MEAVVHERVGPAMVLVLMFSVAPAEAQHLWDVAGSAGLFTSHIDAGEAAGYADQWDHTAQGAIVVGRYLSRHLKLELEASTTSRGVRYASAAVTLPDLPYPYPVFSEISTSVRSLSGVVAWQFRDNEWVHPFVLAGLSADWDAVTAHVPPQSYRGDPRVPSIPIAEGGTESETTQRLRGVLGAGAKLYFTERAFVRTDGRLSWSPDRQNLSFRAGVGIDF